MKTEQKLHKMNLILSVIAEGREKIKLRQSFIEQFKAIGATEKIQVIHEDNCRTERAIERLKSRLSKLSFDVYLMYASTDDCYTDCKRQVDIIEGFYYEKQMGQSYA
jgi:hypothetical protein